MSTRRRRRTASSSARLLELGMLAPAIAGTRLSRIVLEGATPSAQGRSELFAMVLEKQVAFAQSWSAIWTETLRMQMQFATAWMSSMPTAAQHARIAHAGLQRIADQALSPVHRRVVANARRLR
ncbi:hypothetical protein [Luteimonas sp. SDU82]|uniref:hypothetical protein n=1 Tax=Luteimonas sp. SDU82 TaxID=3422592 RepID=UPI003EBAC45E